MPWRQNAPSPLQTSRKQKGNAKKRYSTDLTDKPTCESQQPVLPLNLLPSPKDDYFDFRSTTAADLLLETTEQVVPDPAREPPYDDLLLHSSTIVYQDNPNDMFFSPMNHLIPMEDNWHSIMAPPSDDPHLDRISDTIPIPVSLKKDPFLPPPRTHSISALDRLALPKSGSGSLSASTSVSSLKEEQLPQPPNSLRSQGSSISLGSFWKSSNSPSSTTKRRAKQSKQVHGLVGLPSLQISTSSLRLRSNSHDSMKSPDSPPHTRPPPTEPHTLAPRRGSLFSGAVPSLVQGALTKDKTHQLSSSCFGATHLKSDADTILATPTPNQTIAQPINYFDLMDRLRQSMKEGGFVTRRLHIPKEFWFQSGVRLPALDAKIETCRLLLIALKPMKARTDFDNMSSAYTELSGLERILEQIHYSFSKKLGITRTSDEDTGATTISDSTQPRKSSHTIAIWSSKLSKSVERMKLESSKSSDDQYNTYIYTLVELLDLVQLLDHWHTHYVSILDQASPDKTMLCKRIIQTTQMCSDSLSRIVCGFLMRDFSRLLNKWIKKCNDWMQD
ncbi:hypothetical protein EC973_004776 [Apophysomyces ossiformis]|uniref:Uncharacterized protein n=1 Tax=Apophysomyces ossiformis TaxID=679940 RepID=A0A8H7ESE5_9FUNG|nr:hypothetical protein EC973_004776 [Apophysomyces ossiformis]